MRKNQEEKDLISTILLFSSRCLDEGTRGVKKSGMALKKLSDIKEKILESYRNAEITYESFCTAGKILNNAIEILETTTWYFVD